jgi:serine/threonine-protein phosphatase CPPED1
MIAYLHTSVRRGVDRVNHLHNNGNRLFRMAAAFFLFLPLAGLLGSFGREQPYYFIVMTDPQFGMFAADKDFLQEAANYQFAIAAVNRLKPKFVIVLGDLVNKAGDPEQIREYRRISGKLDPSIPMYTVAGNHDVGNEPTTKSLGAYRKDFGRDHYSFRAGPIYGIVLDSTLIHEPKNALGEYQEQDRWWKAELEIAKARAARKIILFQHHPLFLKSAAEPDQYENIPLERRRPMLELLQKYGIRNVFAGHTHKNVLAEDAGLEIVATGPLGKPLGQDGSGLRVVAVSDAGMQHRYYDFGRLPDRLDDIFK